jgi:hypothetical protein
MGIYVSAVVGLVIWIVLWAFNVKAIDGFMLTLAIVLSATVAHLAGPYVRQLLKP